MILQMLFKNVIFLFVKKIFEMYTTQKALRYLPKRDQHDCMPGGI